MAFVTCHYAGDQESSPDLIALHRCRTKEDIIKSCLVTIFACTWVALHPNIPAPEEGRLKVTGRRVGVMIMALIAPEVVIVWALRQHIVARELMESKHKEYEWTKAHAYFFIMGGFMFYDGDTPVRTVQREDIQYLSVEDLRITQAEIEDRSKSDMLSKGLAVVQTGWFILQCIARRIEHLPISTLELITVAFATLNFATYGLWWYKPLNVQRPFRVKWKQEYTTAEIQDSVGDGLLVNIRRVVLFPLLPFNRMARGEDLMEAGAKRVPTFYPKQLEGMNRWWTAIAGIIVATLFGGIHCVAWTNSFQVLSDTQQKLWRIASISITVLPVPIWTLATVMDRYIRPKNPLATHDKFISMMVVAIGAICGIMYFLARATLLVLAYMSLDRLPPAVYLSVYWTNFIPHV